MGSITAMNKKNLQWVLEERACTQKFTGRNTSTTTNRSQSPDRVGKGVSGPNRTNRERVEYSPVPTHGVRSNRTSITISASTLLQLVASEPKWVPPLPDLKTALAGPRFPWIPAPDVRLRLKMVFKTLVEYNDLWEEALVSLNPRPQCVRKLCILVKKHYHPSA